MSDWRNVSLQPFVLGEDVGWLAVSSQPFVLGRLLGGWLFLSLWSVGAFVGGRISDFWHFCVQAYLNTYLCQGHGEEISLCWHVF